MHLPGDMVALASYSLNLEALRVIFHPCRQHIPVGVTVWARERQAVDEARHDDMPIAALCEHEWFMTHSYRSVLHDLPKSVDDGHS